MRRLFLLALLLTACVKISEEGTPKETAAKADDRPREKVTIRGSEAMRRLTAALAKAHGKIDADVQGGGTAAGFQALATNAAHVAQASRPASPEERAAVPDLVETPVAFDAVAVYVHDANPVFELSTTQLASILTGATTNWRDVGGPNAPIAVYGAAESAGVTGYLGLTDAPRPQRDFADARGVVGAVAEDPNAIGYAGLVSSVSTRPVWIRRPDGVAVAPTPKTVRDRSYPLSGRLYLYTRANAPGPAREFVTWCRGQAAQKAIAEAGYVQP